MKTDSGQQTTMIAPLKLCIFTALYKFMYYYYYYYYYTQYYQGFYQLLYMSFIFK